MKEDMPNIAMADTFMAIFGYKRIKPTNEELELKYRKRDINKIVEVLEDVHSNK